MSPVAVILAIIDLIVKKDNRHGLSIAALAIGGVMTFFLIIGLSGDSSDNGNKPTSSTPSVYEEVITENQPVSAPIPAATPTPTPTPAPTPTPTPYTYYLVTDLFDDVDDNALRAESEHKGEYVEIEGYLDIIDNDGKYIVLGAGSSDFSYLWNDIRCTIKNNEQKEIIMTLNTGDRIIVRGKITNVGTLYDYTLDIESLEKAD